VYASFGSGRLLFDFLFLRDVLAEGRRLRRVCLIDEMYDACDDERQASRYHDHQVRASPASASQTLHSRSLHSRAPSGPSCESSADGRSHGALTSLTTFHPS
jgi:hypothetical protein